MRRGGVLGELPFWEGGGLGRGGRRRGLLFYFLVLGWEERAFLFFFFGLEGKTGTASRDVLWYCPTVHRTTLVGPFLLLP
jgi:hypothetical protein